MNVQELIDELTKVEDKTLPVVYFYFDGDYNCRDDITDVGTGTNDKGKPAIELRNW